MNRRAAWLLVGSLGLALAVCEGVLRLAGDRLVSRAPATLSFAVARPYAEHIQVASGVDREWFVGRVPDLPNRRPVEARSNDLYQEYGRRNIYAPESFYVFNRVYVKQNACTHGGLFEHFPPDILVFDPPDGRPYPRFRYLGGRTFPSQLVSNAFGWRGPEVPLQKPPRTIRLAFVGASTTVDQHSYAGSYPELIGYWFNRYFASRGERVQVDIINAGREGIGSTDIEAIVRYELSPAEPDFVIYYEGANQFDWRPILKVRSAQAAAAPHMIPELPPVATGSQSELATVRLLKRARAIWLDRRPEPAKPNYDVLWPPQLSRTDPDLSRADLPVNLHTILTDLDGMDAVLKPMGSRLVVSSFVRLIEEGMVLSATRHRHIYNQLNLTFWPIRYETLRGFHDFQNRVFRKYARKRSLPFVDVAAWMPRDPDLFVDSIHMTEEGSRLRAWVVFQDLVPLVRDEIDAGRLPRPSRAHLERHPWIAEPLPMTLDCKPLGAM